MPSLLFQGFKLVTNLILQNVCDNTYGCLGSSFDLNTSSTLVNDLPGKFAYSYGSGANGTGDYVTDSIQIGGQTIDNARFGIAHASYGSVLPSTISCF